MIKVADLKKYAEKVGIQYPPACRSKKMVTLIAKSIEVPLNDLERIVKHAKNMKLFREEIKELINTPSLFTEDVKPVLQEEVPPETVEPLVKTEAEFLIIEQKEERLLLIENISKRNYTIKGLILMAGEVTQIDSKYRMNADIMKRINYHIELKIFKVVT